MHNVISIEHGRVTARPAPSVRFLGCRFHRNGIAGAGFYAVRLEWRSGRERYTGTAIVFDAAEHIAIIADGDIETRFRCEDFEPELRAYVMTPNAQALAFGGAS